MTRRKQGLQRSFFDRPEPKGQDRCPIAQSGEHVPGRTGDGIRCVLCALPLPGATLPPMGATS